MKSSMISSLTSRKGRLPVLKTGLTIFLISLFLSLSSAVTYAQQVVSSAVAYSSSYIQSDSSLMVWGSDQYLHTVITNTGTAQDLTPVTVKFPQGVTAWREIAAGQSHMLALGNDGNIYAWGLNNYGQLGDSSTANDSDLVMVRKPTGVTGWTAVAAGAFYSMAIANTGDVYAWGFNNFGQLGNGATSNDSIPTLVKLPTGVTAKMIAAGTNFGFAVGSNDSLYSWGRNINGELAIGNTKDQHTPVAVKFPAGVTAWTQIAEGAFTSYALGNDGNIYSAGSNGNGQVGDGTTTQRTSFVKVIMPGSATGWKSFSPGASFCFGIASNDSLYGWGFNGPENELAGVTSNKNNPTPLAITTLPYGVSATSIASGHNHALIIGSDSRVYGWGLSSAGEVGYNSTFAAVRPVLVDIAGYAAPMLSGPATDNVLELSDSLLAWQIAANARYYGLQIASDSAFSKIVIDTLGVSNTSFEVRSLIGPILSLGTKYFWRVVAVDTLGGSFSSTYAFVTLGTPAQTGARLAAQCNSNSSYYINAMDTLFAWGDNQYGQLGNGSTSNDSIAAAVPFPTGVTGWKMVAGGDFYTLAVGSNDSLYAWGHNNDGQLGNGTFTNSSAPIAVPMPTGVTGWTAVAAGAGHSLAIGNNGQVYAWGYNNFGQLGDSSTADTSLPVPMKMPSGLNPVNVIAGNNCSLVLFSNGALYATGRNGNGQIGFGSTSPNNVDTLTMVQFPAGVTGWLAVAAGGFHVIAVGNDGNLYGWGSDGAGQLADGTKTSAVTLPIEIAMPTGVTGWNGIACGENFTAVIGDNGNVYEAGYSNDGETGNGTTSGAVQTLTMSNVPSGVTSFAAIAAGHNHVITVASNGSLYAWGANSSGQLGDDGTSNSLVPVEVLFSAPPVLPMPVLLAPTNADTLAAVDTSLVWSSVSGAASYNVQIASDTAFTSIVVDSTVNGDTTMTINKMIDSKLALKTKYFWRVMALNGPSSSQFSLIWSFITPSSVTGIVGNRNGLPKTFALMQNYPNPFNPTTIIKYSLPKAQFVTLTVYNVLGQKVVTLVNERQGAGYYEVNFSADRFASGVYFYILKAGNFISTKKMMLLK